MKQTSNGRMNALILAFLILIALLTVLPASALKVEGARIALDVEAGKTYTSPIGISINPNEPEGDFSISVLGFGQAADGTYTALESAADTAPTSARTMISIDKPSVHLKPGERADVTATIAIPSGTRDGGRYAIIMVQPATAASGQQTSFATAVAIPVFLTIKSGTSTETGEVVSVDAGKIEPGKTFTVTSEVRNNGNYHYYGTVSNVTVTDSSGKTLVTAKTEPFTKAIVPGQQAQLKVTFAAGIPEGTYLLTSRMEKLDGVLLGEKTLQVQVGNPAPVQATTQMTQGSPGLFIPGFGSVMTIAGFAGALLGIFWCRRGGKG